MSHNANPEPSEVESLSDAFALAAALSAENNKPDSRTLLSPISPLVPASSIRSTTSSSSTSTSTSSGFSAGPARSNSVELPPVHSSAAPHRPTHRRTTSSGPLIYTSSSWSPSTASTASSSPPPAAPTGNISPLAKSMAQQPRSTSCSARADVLRFGSSANYGHGSIVRAPLGRHAVIDVVVAAMGSTDPEEVKRVGNEQYRKGNFEEALRLYDRAIAMCPESAACRSNRAAALIALGRLNEAAKDCDEAIRLDPVFARAHQRLASVHLRLGHVNDARKHLFLATAQPDALELQKLQAVEKHLARCADARKAKDWKTVLIESAAAISAGSDASSFITALKAEGLLWLCQLGEADSAMSHAHKLHHLSYICSDAKFFGFRCNSFIHFVDARVSLALGRFENAIAAAGKAKEHDPDNIEVTELLSNVRRISQARALGNELFNSGNFAEACSAYGEGLKHNPSCPVIYCNRAACWYKLGQWEKSINDCNEALKLQPSYTKALLRRAASYGKVERWEECVRDYEILRKELPRDTDISEALFHAQVALQTSRGDESSNMKFRGKVEKITSIEQLQIAITLPGITVVHFTSPSNQNCTQVSPFMDTLCSRYPSVNFLKVDMSESPDVAKVENVRTVPTFKIYKNGIRLKEMICPTQQVLENSMRHYGV